MFNTSEQILQQFLAGEDSRAEFKEIRFGGRGVISPNAEEFAGELVAFANAEGGVVFLGVDDSGTVMGIPQEKIGEVEQWILNIATHNCDPPIRPDLRKVLLPGAGGEDQLVLLAEVPRGLYVHRTSGGRYYTRIGSTKRNLTSPELARLFQQRGREYVFDEQPVLSATVDDLNRNRLEAFFGRSPTIPWLDLLRNTRVTFQDESGVDRPTIAGLLVFATEPTMFLASGSIEAACYHGTRLSSDDLIHDERLTGPVSDQIDAGIAFVTRFMQTGNSSEAHTQYDIDVVDEAIVNAVAHRDYAIAGSKIRLFLFADRLELYSPGGLPNTITLEDMPYRTFTRNQLLVSFLSRLRSKRTGQVFLESRGEGVRKILEDGEAYSGRRPRYELFGDELRLTLWAKGDAVPETD
ncbi:MAG: putative DNA binding domain-containing protein [Gammaproteobacteria bacterium]|nr:putative DNA binding domain-containing protein [Gammaproteobacteria bacterium]